MVFHAAAAAEMKLINCLASTQLHKEDEETSVYISVCLRARCVCVDCVGLCVLQQILPRGIE